MDEPRPYKSYLVRMWQAHDSAIRVWRASLEGIQTGERVGFASLEEMFEFLRAETGVGDERRRTVDERRC